jgi:SnoaL-like domain
MDAVWAHEPYVRTIHPGNRHADAGWEAVRVGWQKLFERFAVIEAGMPEPHLRVGDDVAWATGEELFRARRRSISRTASSSATTPNPSRTSKAIWASTTAATCSAASWTAPSPGTS